MNRLARLRVALRRQQVRWALYRRRGHPDREGAVVEAYDVLAQEEALWQR